MGKKLVTLIEGQPLIQGICSNATIARWMGIAPSSFCANKQKKLEELKYYADFEITDTGKINIIKVLKEEPYEKQAEKRQKWIGQFITRRFGDNYYCIVKEENGLMSKEIGQKLGLKPNTQYEYLLKKYKEFFGIGISGKQYDGQAGRRRYYYMVVDENGNRRPMTEKEQKIKKDLLKKWYGDIENAETISHLTGEYEAGHISKQDYEEALGEIHSQLYEGFMLDMEAYIGVIVRVHYCEWRVTAFNWLKENGYFTEEQLEYFNEHPVLAW